MDQRHLANSKRIAKNTGYLYIRLLVVTVINLIISRVILRALGFEDFGIYNVVGSMVVLFGFLNIALRSASVRYLAVELGKADNAQLDKVFSMVINCHAILVGCLWVLVEAVGLWFINFHMQLDPSRLTAANWAFQFSTLTFLVSVLQAPFDSNIVAHEQMNFYATISIVESLLKLLIAYLVLISSWDKLITFSALLFAASLVICSVYVLYNRLHLQDSHYIRHWDKTLVVQFVNYSGWSLFVNAADTGVHQLRIVFFDIFLGTIANAALGIANQVFNAVTMVFGNFSAAFSPQIVKSYAAGDKDYFMHLIFTTSKVSFFLFLLPALPLILNLNFVLHVWLVDVPPLTAEYIGAMFFFAIFDSFQAPLWNAVYATGNIRTHQILMGSIKLLVIPITWLILWHGDNGVWAIIAWAIGNLLCTVVRTIYCHHHIHLDLAAYAKKVLLPICITSLIAISLPLYLTHHMEEGWTTFIISTVVAISLTLVTTMFIGLTSKERQLILSFRKQ